MSRSKPNRTRKNAHIIYLSDEEEAAVKLRMERVRIQSFSKYCRKMMIDGYVLVIDDSKELKEFTLEINKIGVNINQIAKKINETGNLYADDLHRLQELIDNIWQLLKSTLLEEL